MLNSVNDRSPLILQGIIKPERTIYLPGNRGPRGENGVDKIYDPNIVYGTNDVGAAVGIPYSANSDPLSIIQRDENGRAQIESPLNDKDIANKEFVENLVKPVSVNVQSNTAKIENLTNILLDNEQVAIAGYSMESEKTYDCVKGGALDRRLKKIEQALKNNL